MKRSWKQWVLPAVALCATGTAMAQSVSYPTRPVRMIVPFAPGGASDVVGRIIAPKLGEVLGQQIVIDNRTGASGNIGVEVAANASPDGYTFLLGNSGTMAINPAVFPKFHVRPVRDFIAVTQVVDVPGILVTHPSVPVSNVKDFIAYVKARPGKLNYGSSGAGSPQRLAMEYFMREAGIDMVHIPYKGGAGGATLAVVAGEVSAVMTSVAAVLPHVKANKLKAHGVVAPKRLAVLPDTPTMAESGFPKMTAGAWQGVYLPVKTPQPVVNKLFSATQKVMADTEVGRRLADQGADIVVSKSPDDFAAFMKSENELYDKLVKQVGAVAE
ncbi:MAG: Bug family tripartite tricarboxylate transporter substrate binding protein [Methanocella sp.]